MNLPHGDGEDREDPMPALALVRRGGPKLPTSIEGPLEVALGVIVVVARPVVAMTAALARAITPFARDGLAILARPPGIRDEWAPAGVVAQLAERGHRVRVAAEQDLSVASGRALDWLVPAIVEPLLDRVDLTGIVLRRVDLERLVGAVLDTMDLTGVVLDRVDLRRIVVSALDSIDLNEIVRTRVDLAGLAEEVIEEVDLPEIIRESSTGVAGEVIDGARLSAVAGDELVNRWIDRLLQRRQARRTTAPREPGPEADRAR